EAAHDRRILGRNPVGEDLRAGGRAYPGRGEQVLEPQRDTVQRPAICARYQLRFGTARRGAGVLGHDRQIGIEVGIPALDAREIGLRQLHRREHPAVEEITRRPQAEISQRSGTSHRGLLSSRVPARHRHARGAGTRRSRASPLPSRCTKPTQARLVVGAQLGEAYPSMVHARPDCDTIAFAMPLRGSGCMPQTSRGCAVTVASDSARVYWDVPKHATNEGESTMHMHGNWIKSLAPALLGLFCVTVGLGGAAQAQTPNLVQPWGPALSI